LDAWRHPGEYDDHFSYHTVAVMSGYEQPAGSSTVIHGGHRHGDSQNGLGDHGSAI
jgi:hypothetical protein